MQTKFTLVLAAILCAAVTTKAQVSKGSTVLGGNLSFSSNKQKDEAGNKNSSTSFIVSPSVGKVYKDNRLIGFVLKYQYQGYDDDNLNTSSFGAGVYLRQYKPLGKGFYFFAQESLNADFNHFRNYHFSSTEIEDSKGGNIYVSVNPGLAYDLSKKIQLELLLFNNLISAGYAHSNVTYEPSDIYNNYKNDNFYINSTLDWSQVSFLNIGMKIFFGR